MSVQNSTKVSSLSHGLHQLGNWLQKPTFALLKKPMPSTNEIFAMYYSKANLDAHPDQAKRIGELATQRQWASAAKVLWVVSIILPILYYLGSLCHQLANLDASARIEHQKMNSPIKTEQIKALRDSVNEFIEIMEKFGCNENKTQVIATFKAQFQSEEQLVKALSQACQNMLQLFSTVIDINHLKVHHQLLANIETVRESDDDLLNNIAYFIDCYKNACNFEKNSVFSYLAGEKPYKQSWGYLISRKERFIEICNHLIGLSPKTTTSGVKISNPQYLMGFPKELDLSESEPVTLRPWNELFHDATFKPVPVWLIGIAQLEGGFYKIYDGIAITKFLTENLPKANFKDPYQTLINLENSSIELSKVPNPITDILTRRKMERVYLFSTDCFKIDNYIQFPADFKSLEFKPFFPKITASPNNTLLTELKNFAVDSVNFETTQIDQLYGSQYIVGDTFAQFGHSELAWKWMLNASQHVSEAFDWVKANKPHLN